MAGITWRNFYFQLFPGSIKSPEVVVFLRHLLRHLPGDLLVIWDGLRQHHSRLVRAFVAAQEGRLELEFLPAYAPEAISSTMNCPTSALAISPTWAPWPSVPCVGCAVAPPSSPPSGGKPNSSRNTNIMRASIG